MKKLIIALLILFCVSCIPLPAQIRQDKETIKFESKSEKLSNATGWCKSEYTGKWVKNKNIIDDKIVTYVFHQQNFTWLQFATTHYNGNKLYILLYEKIGGSYRYPSILTDWRSYNQTYFFIIDSTDYQNLKNTIYLQNNKDIIVYSPFGIDCISDFMKDYYGVYNDETLLTKITTSFESEYNKVYKALIKKSREYGNCFKINSQKINETEIIRFRLPEYCYLSSLNTEDKRFNKAYFEISFKEFIQILID